ncbi:hypothetical protein J0J30_23500, partial [Vibrio vulnificus]|nr:hypothetical protein [Vibrio vulnificus]
SNNHITNLDIEILWHLEERRQINFPHLMLHMMKRKRQLLYAELTRRSSKPKGMPFGAHIIKILKECGVDFHGETATPFPHNWRVTTMNLKT